MKKLFLALKRVPRRTSALTAVLALTVAIPALSFAWGPSRPTFTMENPAPYVTFNSITDNPAVGDERNFVRIKEAGASTWSDSATVQPGKQYSVMVYYHNNAATDLNASGKGIAHNAFMRVQMPSSVAANSSANVDGVVGASNANPGSVWDDSKLVNATGAPIALAYVPSSAVIHNNGTSNGSKMPDALFGNGTPLGFNSLDGTLPGCTQFSGYVTFDVSTAQPNFTVNKTVRIDGHGSYAKSVTAQPGQTLDYEVEYNNTGTTTQSNVVIQDKLPAGVSYVPGSTQLANPTTDGKWVNQTSNDIVTNGVGIGTYGPNSNAYVKFKAKVADNNVLPTCGKNSLVNTATAKTDNGDKSSTATVVVTKTCVIPPVEKVSACNTTTGVIEQVEKGKENTAPYTTDLAKCTKVQVCNTETGKTVTVTKDQENTPPYSTDSTKCAPPVTPPTTPVTPPATTTLPETGAADVVMPLLGVGSLIAAVSYYVASRRALLG